MTRAWLRMLAYRAAPFAVGGFTGYALAVTWAAPGWPLVARVTTTGALLAASAWFQAARHWHRAYQAARRVMAAATAEAVRPKGPAVRLDATSVPAQSSYWLN